MRRLMGGWASLIQTFPTILFFCSPSFFFFFDDLLATLTLIFQYSSNKKESKQARFRRMIFCRYKFQSRMHIDIVWKRANILGLGYDDSEEREEEREEIT
ncbi:hypothetical protein OCU04_004035 [Sclerotinia nivalis]|uniref:Uncharacterized protein n=1 Tax=Sclerotinia nivalis TaxID=352851 RepID=A0A9X0AT55_9HELO|nr:hypothetical protein OCU04_004035 [Sclerotinia nivalis]